MFYNWIFRDYWPYNFYKILMFYNSIFRDYWPYKGNDDAINNQDLKEKNLFHENNSQKNFIGLEVVGVSL